jgi:hypothetical protein
MLRIFYKRFFKIISAGRAGIGSHENFCLDADDTTIVVVMTTKR